MTTFTTDSDNNITAHATAEEATSLRRRPIQYHSRVCRTGEKLAGRTNQLQKSILHVVSGFEPDTLRIQVSSDQFPCTPSPCGHAP